MRMRFIAISSLACIATLLVSGCNAPGKPKQAVEIGRPDDELDAAVLYKQNCSACHGEQGRNGASISLANPVYLAAAGEANIEQVTAAGVHGSLMPGFGKGAGGLLTDKQIAALAHGIVNAWGNPQAFGSQTPPPYKSDSTGEAAQGEKTFVTYCARCHGNDGTGTASAKGSLVDPAYLALVSDQYLRSTIIAGKPEAAMPDWRSDVNGHPMTSQEITDTVAWLASHRVATPGQPYQQHQK